MTGESLTIGILTIVMGAAIIILAVQNKRLRAASRNLNSDNAKMHGHVEALSETRDQLTSANDQLTTANDQLTTVNGQLTTANNQLTSANNQLTTANTIKEQCINSMFSACSDYINQMEDYRREINRKIKANKYAELQKLTSQPTRSQTDLRAFYGHIDRTVLEIYPSFVEEFNSLLRPEEHILPKDGEMLNTTLRIYALVRLGITDSMRIASMLRISPQTIYNNRQMVLNKAIGSREGFVERVRSLGSYKAESGAYKEVAN